MKIINIHSILLILLLTACTKDDAKQDARAIRPEKWFSQSEFISQNYSHHLHSYTFETSLGFEEINKIVQSELGGKWAPKPDAEDDFEQVKKLMLDEGIEVLGLSVYLKKNGDYGSVSPMLTKPVGMKADSNILILNINDPSSDPRAPKNLN